MSAFGKASVGQRAKADEAYAEAEKLVTPPSGRLSKMMWKRETEKAAAKYQEAGLAFAACGAKDLAVKALMRVGGQCRIS